VTFISFINDDGYDEHLNGYVNRHSFTIWSPQKVSIEVFQTQPVIPIEALHQISPRNILNAPGNDEVVVGQKSIGYV
jgi:hypothetical protein